MLFRSSMENKVKISKKVLLMVALILVLVVGTTAYLNQKDISRGTYLTVIKGDKETARYSMKDLMEMDKAKVKVDLKSAAGKDVKGEFTGVWLCHLLKSTGINEKEYETVLLIGGDGYTSAAKSKEAGKILVAYAVDGNPLEKYGKGGTGPIRCIFAEDTFGNRSVMHLVRIQCN